MRLGCVVSGRNAMAFEWITTLGASAISVPIRPGRDQKTFLRAAHRDHNLAVLGVLDRASFRARLDWRASAEADINHAMDLVEGGDLDALAIGREPDDGWRGGPDDPLVAPRGGLGSWALPVRELAELISLLRTRMREVPFPIPLVLGGLCSWRPEILDTLDLSLLDGILVHPYGTALDPEDALATYLDGLAAVLAERDLTGQVRLGIGELGRSDQGRGRGEIADWFGRALAYLDGRGDVDCAFICCDSDLTLDGFGQFDAKGRAKPSVSTIFDMALRLPAQDPLIQVSRQAPDPDPDPPTEQWVDWEDPCFSPEDVATALAATDGQQGNDGMVNLVRDLWPLFEPYLTRFGVTDDPVPRAALLAALYVASAGHLRPTVEGGSYTRAEHRYGGILGNRYHGDGYRYRGRGLVRLLGRDAYARYEHALGLPLLDEPDLMLEPAIAAGVTAMTFQQAGLFEAAGRGDWPAVWRGVEPRLNGYGAFLTAVQHLLNVVDARTPAADGRPNVEALQAARSRLGDPYRSDGDQPGGFDGPGLITWAYGQVGVTLPPSLDALVAATRAIGVDAVQPGDLVLYEYGDLASGGSRYDHVALVLDEPSLVLDARFGSGVGYRPHVRGAIRRYRQVVGPAPAPAEEEDKDEMAWQDEKARLTERLQHMATRLMGIHERLEQARDMPEQPTEKAPKKEWLEWGRRVHRWRQQENAELERHFGSLRSFEQDLQRLAEPATPRDDDKPEPKPEEAPEQGAADGQAE